MTDEGTEEAKILGVALSKIPWNQVFSSDLLRARTTCNLIMQQSQHTADVHTTSLLREVCFGVREGLPRGTSVQEAKSIIAVRESITDISMISDYAESDSAVHHRQWTFINHMMEMLSSTDTIVENPKILIVTHGAFIRLFLRDFCHLRGFEKIKNCSVTKLTFELTNEGASFAIKVDDNDVNNDMHLVMRNEPVERLERVYDHLHGL